MFDLIPYALAGALSLGVGGYAAAPAIADKLGSSSSSSSSSSSDLFRPLPPPSKIVISRGNNCTSFLSGRTTCTYRHAGSATTSTTKNPLTGYNSRGGRDGLGNGYLITTKNGRTKNKVYSTVYYR